MERHLCASPFMTGLVLASQEGGFQGAIMLGQGIEITLGAVVSMPLVTPLTVRGTGPRFPTQLTCVPKQRVEGFLSRDSRALGAPFYI